MLSGSQVCERTCHSAGTRCSMSYCWEAKTYFFGDVCTAKWFPSRELQTKTLETSTIYIYLLYIYYIYIYTYKHFIPLDMYMGILCFESLGLKNCWWIIYGSKLLTMVAMAMFGKMAHVSTEAFCLGNPACNFWCLNVYDISPLNQHTLKMSIYTHIVTCSEV